MQFQTNFCKNQLENVLLNQEKEVEKEVVSEEIKNKIDADILNQNKEVLEELKVVQNKFPVVAFCGGGGQPGDESELPDPDLDRCYVIFH